MTAFASVFSDEVRGFLDHEIATAAARPELFGHFDQAKYDEVRQRLRDRRAELARGREECARTGAHAWGAITTAGGFCGRCDGDGLAHGEEGASAWDDCSHCNGLGYTPTEYVRTCTRCGHRDARGGRA